MRLAEARYFCEQYVRHCGPPVDSYFLMCAYFDAFLFALASVPDMASAEQSTKLRDIPVFRFFQALRNITTHHSILAAVVAGNKFPRPFSRDLRVSLGGPPDDQARLLLRLDVLLEILDAVEKSRPSEKYTIAAARTYIGALQATGTTYYLEQLMLDSLRAISDVVDVPELS